MTIPFCDYHIGAFLFSFELEGASSTIPLDLALGRYFKTHKSLGAQDRKEIGEAVFGMCRWKNLLDYLCGFKDPLSRLYCYKNIDFAKISADPSIPEAIRLGMPDILFEHLKSNYGLEEAKNLARVLNTQAPMTVRANLLKTTREYLMDIWRAFPMTACSVSAAGIHFHKRMPLFSLQEFKDGLFEVQDEGSQVVASLIDALPGQVVLDFCSGSGGKTLAFAPNMKGRGQIYLHDIRSSALIEARKRLKRAGIQNAQFLFPGHKQLSRLKGKCDWVLVDVPCSGTGTLRRNPDQKWRFSNAMLDRFISLQQEIALQAISYLKPGGRLVYATCSILSVENEEQVKALLDTHSSSLELISTLKLLPKEGGMDGFFAALFRKIQSMV